jgi:hypothetical protein
MEKAPQNLIVDGFTSKNFTINFLHNLKQDECQLYIESILNDLMDYLGDTFKATICLQIITQSTYDKSYISIQYNEYQWLHDISQRVSKFLDKINNRFSYISIGMTCRSVGTNHHNYLIFNLIAKDGIYLDKKVTKTNQIIKTINDNSGFRGQQYPEYIFNTIDF